MLEFDSNGSAYAILQVVDIDASSIDAWMLVWRIDNLDSMRLAIELAEGGGNSHKSGRHASIPGKATNLVVLAVLRLAL